ncbi:MAG: YbbR-like domain-containing protein [Bacilli bacterium]
MNKNKKNIFTKFWKFIDRKIILPITKLIISFNKLLEDNSKNLEKFLSKKTTLVFISLLIAFTYFFMVDIKNVNLIQNSAEVLYNQNVTAIYNEEKYVVEGLPENVDITLIGRTSDIYLAKQLKNQEVTVDLSDLKAGTHKVELKYQQPIDTIKYKLDPSTVTVVIYNKESSTKQLNIDVINKELLDTKLNVNTVTSTTSNVIVKGASHMIEKVASVKALVDVNNIANIKVGDNQVQNVPLVAYDKYGNVVDVEILPEKIDVVLNINSPSKTVPIEVVPSGEVAFGKAIKQIKTNIKSITIYGDSQALANVEKISIPLDVTDLNSNKEFNVNIDKPNGITFVSETRMKINVVLEEETSKEITNVRITPLNVLSGLKVEPLRKEDAYITVIVKGTESVISSITESDIIATIDLNNLKAGTHEVDIIVNGKDLRVIYIAKVKKIKIRLYE